MPRREKQILGRLFTQLISLRSPRVCRTTSCLVPRDLRTSDFGTYIQHPTSYFATYLLLHDLPEERKWAMSFNRINRDKAGSSSQARSTQPTRTLARISPKALTSRPRCKLAVDQSLDLCSQYRPEKALTRLVSDKEATEGVAQMVHQILLPIDPLAETQTRP